MAGQEKEFPCLYCGEPTTKTGSIKGFHYHCSDKALEEWPGMKKKLEGMQNVKMVDPVDSIQPILPRIKFRAWDESKDRFAIQLDSLAIQLDGEDLLFIDDEIWMVSSRNDLVLMQYTGFQDQNGKEIYDQDVLFDDEGNNEKYLLLVSWDAGSGSWVVTDDYGNTEALCDLAAYSEIIGNVFEHKEDFFEIFKGRGRMLNEQKS